MESTSTQLVPSPSSPGNAIVSPETLSHHSSPAKTSRIQHHVTIDETNLPISLSSHHQLVSAGGSGSISSIQQNIPQSIVSIPSLPSNTPTQQIAFWYHSSQHHHHQFQPALPPARRPSRLPEPRIIQTRVIKP